MMRSIALAIILFIFTLPTFTKNTILVVGDSISAAYGMDVNQGWVALLQKRLDTEKLDYKVVNASTSGDTTSNGLAKLPNLLSTHHPAITIIELGGNDGLRGVQPLVIKLNLKKMITLAKDAGSQVIIVTIQVPANYGPAYNEKLQKLYTDLADEEDIVATPLFEQHKNTNEFLQADGIHPTSDAQPLILNHIWESRKPLLKD